VATDSIRKKAVAGTVAALATIAAGSTYFYTLTGVDAVSSAMDADDARLSLPGDLSVRVQSYDEDIKRWFENSLESGSTFRLVMDLLLRSKQLKTLDEQLNDAIHDVQLCIGANRLLGNSVTDAFISRIDPPIYDHERNLASVIMYITAIYDYTPGSTI
jgi:hypothetical protein